MVLQSEYQSREVYILLYQVRFSDTGWWKGKCGEGEQTPMMGEVLTGSTGRKHLMFSRSAKCDRHW